jgi:hypothetical protein
MTEPTPEKPFSDKIADAAFKFIFLGTGGYAVYLLFDEQLPKAAIAATVSACSALLLSSFGDGLMKVLKDSMSRRGEQSGAAIDNAINQTQERVQTVISRFEKKYLDALKAQSHLLEAEGEPDIGGIPLKNVYVPLQVISTRGQNISTAPQQIWYFLPKGQAQPDQFQHRRISIAAEAGAGKTTLLRYLTLCYGNDGAIAPNRNHGCHDGDRPSFNRLKPVPTQSNSVPTEFFSVGMAFQHIRFTLHSVGMGFQLVPAEFFSVGMTFQHIKLMFHSVGMGFQLVPTEFLAFE